MVELFAGIGGFSLGFERAGFTTTLQCEINATCQLILERHFPTTTKHHDVKTLDLKNPTLRSAHVICGGFPCQDLSLAGTRSGLAGKRSSLWFAFLHVIETVRPPWVVVENVPGLLSSNSGRDLATILYGLTQLGYCVSYRCLDAQYFNLAQSRERLFLVASLGNIRSTQVLFEPESLCWNPPPRRETQQKPAPTLEGCPGTSSSIAYGGNNTSGPRDTTTAIRAHAGHHYDFESETFIAGTIMSPGKGYTPNDFNLIAKCLNAGRDGYNDDCDQTYVPISFAERGRPDGPSLESQPNLAYALTSPTGGNRSNEKNVCYHGVRRLTPLECERLQGFPENWTQNLSDSARYRILGNAVPPPITHWIASRILSCQ